VLYTKKNLDNGCSINEPFRCRIVTVTNATTNETTKETICAENYSKCPKVVKCKEGDKTIECPDGTCVNDV